MTVHVLAYVHDELFRSGVEGPIGGQLLRDVIESHASYHHFLPQLHAHTNQPIIILNKEELPGWWRVPSCRPWTSSCQDTETAAQEKKIIA